MRPSCEPVDDGEAVSVLFYTGHDDEVQVDVVKPLVRDLDVGWRYSGMTVNFCALAWHAVARPFQRILAQSGPDVLFAQRAGGDSTARMGWSVDDVESCASERLRQVGTDVPREYVAEHTMSVDDEWL